MKIFICEICGDAYIGEEKPADCPFCGARANFIKEGKLANPIVNQHIEISEQSRKNLLETLDLEIKANAIYLCMAGKTKDYAVKAMYKRLAKIELEHAVIVTKLLGINLPPIDVQSCSDEDLENFQRTIELEEHATDLYQQFARQAQETNLRIFFTALSQAEKGHIELIKNNFQ
jgi:rubrerythrin